MNPVTVLAVGASAIDSIQGFQRGGRLVGVTKGEFSLLDLVDAFLTKTGPANVTVSTWTPGRSEMEAVCSLLDVGKISRFRLLVDRSFPTRHPDYVERLVKIVGDSEIRMTRTHAKFALISGGDWRITIRTSMNFNSNPRFEQFDVDDDPAIFGFFDELVDSLFSLVPTGLDVPGPIINATFTEAFANRATEPAPVPDPDTVLPDSERARLDKMLSALWGKCERGDVQAISQSMKIQERLATLERIARSGQRLAR